MRNCNDDVGPAWHRVDKTSRETPDSARDGESILTRRRFVSEPPPDAIRGIDELRKKLERRHTLRRQTLDLIGQGICTAHHVDPDSGQVEVGVAEGKSYLGTDDPATGIDDAPGQMSCSIHRPTGLSAKNHHLLTLTKTETLPDLECVPLGIGGNRHITPMGGDFAVPKQVKNRHSAVILSYSEAALRVCMWSIM